MAFIVNGKDMSEELDRYITHDPREDTPVCPSCGVEIGRADEECPECGYKADEGEEE